MPSSITAIFTTTGADSAQIISKLRNESPDISTVSSSWSLTHSLHRSTSTPSSQPNAAARLQSLQLSHHPSTTFSCGTTIDADHSNKTTTIAVPRDKENDADFRRLLQDKFGLMWQWSKQGEMRASGAQLKLPLFLITVADLSRDRGAASGGMESRGTLVAVSLLGDNHSEPGRFAEARSLIGNICEDLGLHISTAAAWGDCGTWQGETELWCQVLWQHATTAARPTKPKD